MLRYLMNIFYIPEKDKHRMAKVEVIPHVSLIQRLLKDDRLSVRSKEALRLTYHDSCYFGRHNGIIAEPRQVISSLNPETFKELKNSREHSFCCGAGGGLMWTEESLGQRINHLRTDEVISAGTEVAATSCPFCLNMLKDGLKDREKGSIQVMDLAQLVAESLA